MSILHIFWFGRVAVGEGIFVLLVGILLLKVLMPKELDVKIDEMTTSCCRWFVDHWGGARNCSWALKQVGYSQKIWMSRLEYILLLDMWLKFESYACCSLVAYTFWSLALKGFLKWIVEKKQMTRFNEETEKINNTILNILLKLIAKIAGPMPIYA